MPLILEPELPVNDLVGRLEQLRRKLRWNVIVSGIVRLLAVVLTYSVVIMMGDRILFWPAPLRAIFLLIGIVGMAVLAHRRLISPWKMINDPVVRARQVEAQTPELHESLSTLMEISALPRGLISFSPQLLHATKSFAVQRSRFVDFTQVVPSKIPIALMSLLLSFLLVAAWFFWTPKPTVALARLLDPYGGHVWPTKTTINVNAPSVIARGEAFWVTAKITGVIPDRLRLAVAFSESTSWEQAISLTPAMDGVETVPIQLDPARVPKSFSYQLSANDATTDWQNVIVQVPPKLTTWNGRPSPLLRLKYPNYTDMPALHLPDGAGALEAVFGTELLIAGATDRPVRSAAIQFRPTDPRMIVAIASLPFADLGLTTIGGVSSTLVLTQPQTLTVSGNGAEIQGSTVPLLSGNHELVFRDVDGLQGHWPIDIRLTSDPSPGVVVDEPSSAGNSLELTAQSTLRLRALVNDPKFAIRHVAIEYRVDALDQHRYLTLYDGDALGNSIPMLLPYSVEVKRKLRPRQLVVDHGIQVSVFRRSDGSSVQPNDIITFSLTATDFDDVTPTKEPGRSTEIELRVVGADRLAAHQRQARQGFVTALQELHKWQTEALQLSQEAESHRRATGELRTEDRDALNRSAAIQQRILDRLGDNRDGLRAAVNRWRQQVMDNPVAIPSEETRANRLADELDRLATEVVLPIGPLLSAARQENEKIPPAARTNGPLPEAVRRQRDAERSLKNLFENASSGRETAALAAEADALAVEQEKVNRQRDELKNAIPQGVATSRLDEEHLRRLNQAKEAQLQLSQRADQLARQLENRADLLKSEAVHESARADALDAQNQNVTPNVANDLNWQANQARKKAEQLNAEAAAIEAAKQAALGRAKGNDAHSLQEKMTAAAESIARNQLGTAQEQQHEIARQIDQVRDALRDPKDPDGDRLSKDRREAENQLDELIRRQEALQDRTINAEQLTDTLKRNKQFEELAREQEKLADRVCDLAEERRREGQTTLGREMEKAANAMDRAREKMEQGQTSSNEQDAALDRMDDAANQARRDRVETEEQLQREKLIKLHERFKGFADRQAGLKAETERLFQSAREGQSWSRAMQKSLFDMARSEQDLAREIELASNQHLANYRVLSRLAKQSAQPLSEILGTLEKIRDTGMTVESLGADHVAISQLQARADKRLKQLLEVLQPPKENETSTARNAEVGKSSNQPGGEKPAPDNDLIPPDAQVKILRHMQSDLRERVEEFRTRHPDPGQWSDADRTLLESFRQEQAELIQLFAEFAPDNQLAPKEKK